jgi:hypothetical protein
VDDLAAEVEAREAALESIRAAHEADVEAVQREAGRRRADLRAELEEVRRSLRADLGSLETEVEALERVRRRLLEGFSRPDGADEPPGATSPEDDSSPGPRTAEDQTSGVDPDDSAEGAISSPQPSQSFGGPTDGEGANDEENEGVGDAPSVDLEDV